MTDRPIIFSGPMVRALLAGTKTQTRRMLRPQPQWLEGGSGFSAGWDWGPLSCWSNDADFAEAATPHVRYLAGDRLWVRESWAPNLGTTRGNEYRADHGQSAGVYAWDLASGDQAIRVDRWHPSIHMPRWASRLTLTVSAVRVQRLQEISEEDARAEGVPPQWLADELGEDERGGKTLTAVTGFRDLWTSLHGASAWDANPWIVALTFTVEHRNIDGEAAHG
ncbi:hypothetical protein [Rubellimicrobium arenae]|uniref:hypothetical protein n=1 Tax=Rubellimicrobium arenae TaxID=2817372 RepID=UPI001B3175F8|nr:hypothetical protein [Rubellimicrobium arenae]